MEWGGDIGKSSTSQEVSFKPRTTNQIEEWSYRTTSIQSSMAQCQK